RPPVLEYPGVCDRDVDRAELGLRSLVERFDCGAVRHVAQAVDCPATGLLDLGANGLEALLPAARDRDARPGLAQRHRGCAADALVRAGDHGNAAVQVELRDHAGFRPTKKSASSPGAGVNPARSTAWRSTPICRS